MVGALHLISEEALSLSAWGSGASAQGSIPTEPDAIMSDTGSCPRSVLLSLVERGVAMIRACGWRCDCVSSIRPLVFPAGSR